MNTRCVDINKTHLLQVRAYTFEVKLESVRITACPLSVQFNKSISVMTTVSALPQVRCYMWVVTIGFECLEDLFHLKEFAQGSHWTGVLIDSVCRLCFDFDYSFVSGDERQTRGNSCWFGFETSGE
jgi:hypothetical protein